MALESQLSNDAKWRLKVAMASPSDGQEVIDKLDDLKFVDVSLSAAQMNTLNASPVAVIAAPGAGKLTEFLGASIYLDAGATPFELGSGTLDLRYENASGGLVGQATNAFVESAADAYFRAPSLACVALVNKAIVAYASADVTAGDGTIYMRLYYRTLTIADIQ